MIALLQPLIPHYREELFSELNNNLNIKIFTLVRKENAKKSGFNLSHLEFYSLCNFSLGPFLVYNFLPLLSRKYKSLILMGSVKHLSTWVLLFLNAVFFRKRIILFGHGLSVYNYEREIIKQPFIRKLMYKLARNAIFYTENELISWKSQLPNLNAISFNNTISGADNLINLEPISHHKIEGLKERYKIKTKVNLIFCSRFTKDKKSHLLIDFLNKIDSKEFGLIIIGEGPCKPNFSDFSNVYDFGKVYDQQIKTDLFLISDLYFQPAWLGLSGVEALLYGLPVVTLKRSKTIHQCVEYGNLIEDYNAIISDSISGLIEKLNLSSDKQIALLQKNSKEYSKEHLSIKDSSNKIIVFLKNEVNY